MPDSTLRLVILGPEWGLPTISPFGFKLETWLRLAGIPYTLEHENDTRAGPKAKSPWIVTDGEPMGDSELIIERLVREHGVDPDAHLTPREKAASLAFRRMFEDHFNFAHMHAMFITDAGWALTRPHFDFIPFLVRPIVVPMIRRSVRQELHHQGMGRHSQAEIDAMARADLDAADALLGDQPFFFGDRPTLADCTAYGFLALTLWSPIPGAHQDHLRELPRLVAFCERMRDRLWSDRVAAHAA